MVDRILIYMQISNLLPYSKCPQISHRYYINAVIVVAMCVRHIKITIYLIIVIIHQGWSWITRVCILMAYHHKQVSDIFLYNPQAKIKSLEMMQQFAAGWLDDATVGMNQPYGRLIWSQTSYRPSYMWHTWISLIKSDPRLEPKRVVVLLNRNWMSWNSPIRLLCGETKHLHPTGRK